MKLRRALRLTLERFVECEVIGQEVCPLMLRWTFLDRGFVRAMVHYFPAEVSDRDPHDHPRPFLTLVLRGNYRDESWERISGGTEPDEAQIGRMVKERLHAGAFRYRSANHLHIVETDEVGCWTLVVMGPVVREWGFVRLTTNSWWPWGKYVQKFGGVVRCDAPPDTMHADIKDVDVRVNGVPVEGFQSLEILAPPPEHVVPRVGDFVIVSDPSVVSGIWGGKVENVLGRTAWVRDADYHTVQSVKLDKLRRPSDEAALIDSYYRRSSGA